MIIDPYYKDHSTSTRSCMSSRHVTPLIEERKTRTNAHTRTDAHTQAHTQAHMHTDTHLLSHEGLHRTDIMLKRIKCILYFALHSSPIPIRKHQQKTHIDTYHISVAYHVKSGVIYNAQENSSMSFVFALHLSAPPMCPCVSARV